MSDIARVIDQERFYLKCKASFQRCVGLEENRSLFKELSCEIDEIELREESISIWFRSPRESNYFIEVEIILLDNRSATIGSYRYIEDEFGNQTDDYLVFD